MKDKTITVRVPDFCPEDCPGFEISEEKRDLYANDRVIRRERHYTCKNENCCREAYQLGIGKIVSQPQCNDCYNPECIWKVQPGENVRINCPHWRGRR